MNAVKQKVLDTVRKNTDVRPSDIVLMIDISRPVVQRYLKELLDEGYLEKHGTPPRVYYRAIDAVSEIVQKSFVYKKSTGALLFGMDGFAMWAKDIFESRSTEEGVNLYEKSFKEYVKGKTDSLFFEMQPRKEVFQCGMILDKLLCLDLYNMFIAGKTKRTKMAVLLETVKESGNRKRIQELIEKHIRLLSYRLKGVFLFPVI